MSSDIDKKRVSIGESPLADIFDSLSNQQVVNKAVYLLRTFGSDLRMEIFSEFCKQCGDADPRCQCWNDE